MVSNKMISKKKKGGMFESFFQKKEPVTSIEGTSPTPKSWFSSFLPASNASAVSNAPNTMVVSNEPTALNTSNMNDSSNEPTTSNPIKGGKRKTKRNKKSKKGKPSKSRK